MVLTKYLNFDLISEYFSRGGTAGVSIFFILSGFILMFTTRNRSNSLKYVLNFIWKRLSRIYPLYWIYALAGMYILGSNKVSSSLLETLLLLPQRNYVLSVAWSLTHEIYFYIVFALFLLFKERLTIFLASIWAIIIITSSFFITKQDNSYLKVIFNYHTVEFITGIYLYKIYELYSTNKTKIAIACTLVIFIYLSGILINNKFSPNDLYQSALLEIIFVIILIFCPYRTLRKMKWLEYIGDMSYGIYLSHFFQLIILAKIFDFFNINNIYIITSTMLASIIIYGHITYQYIEKPLIKISKKIPEELSLLITEQNKNTQDQ